MTSWSTRVAIADWKQAIDLEISAVPPSEAADTFLMHLQDSPAWPEESARDHIHRTIPRAASGSAWIPPHVSDDEVQVGSCLISHLAPRNWLLISHLATWQLCRNPEIPCLGSTIFFLWCTAQTGAPGGAVHTCACCSHVVRPFGSGSGWVRASPLQNSCLCWFVLCWSVTRLCRCTHGLWELRDSK